MSSSWQQSDRSPPRWAGSVEVHVAKKPKDNSSLVSSLRTSPSSFHETDGRDSEHRPRRHNCFLLLTVLRLSESHTALTFTTKAGALSRTRTRTRTLSLLLDYHEFNSPENTPNLMVEQPFRL